MTNSLPNPAEQGWRTCGPREFLIWSASELWLPKLEHNNASKWNSTARRQRNQYVKRSFSRSL